MRLLNSPEPGFLNEEQRAQAAALFDALLPGSSDAPGATDAGAVDYLDSLLTRDPTSYYEIQGWRDLYTHALSALDEAARQANGRGGLAALGREEVTALLGQLQRGEAEGLPDGLDQKRVFTTMRNHCIEGCFADPRWRGNRDAVMWRWLGSHGPAEEFHRGKSEAEVGHGV
jgi:gluconate 2-dehydrogenase gamma chain